MYVIYEKKNIGCWKKYEHRNYIFWEVKNSNDKATTPMTKRTTKKHLLSAFKIFMNMWYVHKGSLRNVTVFP